MFHVGQARLARYPIHFHFDEDFNYRAEKYGEIDPQDGFFKFRVILNKLNPGFFLSQFYQQNILSTLV